jgi:hypothetical protein
VGDVSSTKAAKTRLAKSAHDAGWSMLKTQLLHKGRHAGECVRITGNESSHSAAPRTPIQRSIRDINLDVLEVRRERPISL